MSTGHLAAQDRKSTRLNSSHLGISYAVFCLKKKKINRIRESVTLCLQREVQNSARGRGRTATDERDQPNVRSSCRAQAFLVAFFLNDGAPPEIYPLPLHGALPILLDPRGRSAEGWFGVTPPFGLADRRQKL